MKKEYVVPSFEFLSFEMQEQVTAGERNDSVTLGDDIDDW